MKPLNLFRLAAVAAALLALAAGCSRDTAQPGTSNAPRQRVTICQGGILAAPATIAKEKGLFATQGVDVTLSIIGDGKAVMGALLEEKCDMALVGEPPIVKQSFVRNDFVIIATVVSSIESTKILARRDRGIRTPRDLVGKRIGVSTGTITHFFLDQFLDRHRIPKGEVTVVDISNQKMAEALRRGDIDAFSASDLAFLKGLQTLGDQGISFNEPGLTTNSGCLVVRKSWLAANRPAALKVLKALQQAVTELDTRPAETVTMLAARLQLPESEIGIIVTHQHNTVALDQTLLLTLESQARWMMENGMVKGTAPPNYLRFIDQSVLRELNPSAVTIK